MKEPNDGSVICRQVPRSPDAPKEMPGNEFGLTRPPRCANMRSNENKES